MMRKVTSDATAGCLEVAILPARDELVFDDTVSLDDVDRAGLRQPQRDEDVAVVIGFG
jgi:hypothetical protein